MIEYEFDSVASFMRALLITEPHFLGLEWIFRGQGDAADGLVPSSRREKSWEPFGGAARQGLVCCGGRVTSTDSDLRIVEGHLLDVLRHAMERMGLPQEMQSEPKLTAYARHIGLPTRALDWTRSPWTAAYFAATNAPATSSVPNSKLAIYAMSETRARNSYQSTARHDVGAVGNPNLLAQQALILELHGDVIDLLDGEPRESRCLSDPQRPVNATDLNSQLLCFTLPTTFAPKLLEGLRRQDIHGASLFPGPTGLVALMRELFL